MELRGDSAGVQVEDEGNGRCVLRAQTDKHVAAGVWFPAGKLLSIVDCFVKNVGGAAPNVVVLELGMWPARTGEDIVRTETSGGVRHVVVELDGVGHSERPELGISNTWPVDSGV